MNSLPCASASPAPSAPRGTTRRQVVFVFQPATISRPLDVQAADGRTASEGVGEPGHRHALAGDGEHRDRSRRPPRSPRCRARRGCCQPSIPSQGVVVRDVHPGNPASASGLRIAGGAEGEAGALLRRGFGISATAKRRQRASRFPKTTSCPASNGARSGTASRVLGRKDRFRERGPIMRSPTAASGSPGAIPGAGRQLSSAGGERGRSAKQQESGRKDRRVMRYHTPRGGHSSRCRTQPAAEAGMAVDTTGIGGFGDPLPERDISRVRPADRGGTGSSARPQARRPSRRAEKGRRFSSAGTVAHRMLGSGATSLRTASRRRGSSTRLPRRVLGLATATALLFGKERSLDCQIVRGSERWATSPSPSTGSTSRYTGSPFRAPRPPDRLHRGISLSAQSTGYASSSSATTNGSSTAWAFTGSG